MTMPRDSVHTRIQSHRSQRKRSAGVSAPSPKKMRSAATLSPRSSPMKRLFGDSDVDSPTFVTKSFYGTRKHAVQLKVKADLLTPSSSASLSVTPSPSEMENTPATPVAKTSPRRLRSSFTRERLADTSEVSAKSRVVLSPLKGQNSSTISQSSIISQVRELQTQVTRKRHRSVPAKVSHNSSQHSTPGKGKSSPAVTEVTTPTSGRKFFKYKSPASASKSVGAIIVGKGFNLKFVPYVLDKELKKSTKKNKPARKRVSQVEKAVGKVSPPDSLPKNGPNFGKKSPEQTGSPGPAAASTEKKTVGGISCGTIPSGIVPQEILPTAQMLSASQNENVIAPGSQSLFSSDTQSSNPGPISSQEHSLPEDDMLPTAGDGVEPPPEDVSEAENSPPTKRRRSERLAEQSSSASSPKTKFIDKEDDQKQLILDAGQKKYGVTQCRVCGMVYAPANPSDESTHARFHQHTIAALRFPGWKKERVVNEFLDDGSRVICVLPEDQNFMKKKVEEVNHVMTQELGFPDQVFTFRPTFKAFFYITDNKRIEGCCIAESITEGYRVLPNNNSETPESQRPWFCSKQPEKASLGIGRLWVYGPSRGRGIATRLVDCVRQWFEYGTVIDKSQIAFSDPTPDGRRFAAKYAGTPRFLVYKYIP